MNLSDDARIVIDKFAEVAPVSVYETVSDD